jgi:predicted extracellular nuclease
MFQLFIFRMEIKTHLCIVRISLYLICAFLGALCPFYTNAQSHVIAFYNVENLFDTIDHPLVIDEEFLPDGANKWSNVRYQQKLQNISKIIARMNPDIIGLCEIENRTVLEDLVKHPNLAGKRYQIAHIDMDDARGVDVALLYRPSVFKPFLIKKIAIKDPAEPAFKTRDILWVKGLFNKDTLHVAVNHWPSRRGGKEDKRLIAATTLKHAVDSVLKKNPAANIVMMGDFNDDPANRSIKKILLAKNASGQEVLFNAAEPTFKKGYGTLGFNGAWNLFDQMIISHGLSTSKVKYVPQSFTIFKQPDMQEPAGKYRGFPRRTFVSGRYDPEGYSDHFPVFIVLANQ